MELIKDDLTPEETSRLKALVKRYLLRKDKWCSTCKGVGYLTPAGSTASLCPVCHGTAKVTK